MKNKEAWEYLESALWYIENQYHRKNTTLSTKWVDKVGTAILKAVKVLKKADKKFKEKKST